MMKMMPLIMPAVCAAVLAVAAVPWHQANNQSSPDEHAYLHMAISDLVLGQTGSTDKQDREKLCDGDRLIKWGDVTLRDNDHLVEVWLASGDRQSVPLTVERQFESGAETFVVDYSIRLASKLFADMMMGGRSEYRQPAEMFPELESLQELPLQRLAQDGLAQSDPEAIDRLARAFRRLTDEVKGHYRSDHVVYLLNRPFHCEAWGRKQCDAIAAAADIADLVAGCWQLASPQVHSPDINQSLRDRPRTLEQWCELITQRVDGINNHYQEALKDLSESELAIWNAWCRDAEPKWRGDDGWDEFVAGFQLTKKLDTASLESAVTAAGHLADDLGPGGFIYEGIVALKRKPSETTTFGKVLIGASGEDRHDVSQPVIFDLGGADEYLFPESGLDPQFPVRFIVDLSGNDQYEAIRNGIAAGVGGISVLIDVQGDDEYRTHRNGIGFAICGLGLLIDADGHDHYRGYEFTQGAGCIGIGLIVDRAGNDRYDAGHYSQALGLPAGCGAIIDDQGDDNYNCTGKAGSPYGDQDEYDGMGQGCGFGFRYLGSGGVGLLMDKAGRDVYRAGQFGLGCGYFYGIGLVNDRDGDDVYECSRYGLGTSAHYAVGIVMDDAGSDFYTAIRRAAVAEMGSAWDLSLGALVDAGGDDIYRGQSYAMGGAAQNAYGFLWDKAGNDAYFANSGNAALGYIGGASYGAGRGARNLALFLDGGGDDYYRMDDRENGGNGSHGEFAVWADR